MPSVLFPASPMPNLPNPPTPPSRILIIRPSALGDVARSVPLLVNLRRAFPKAAIDWLVQEGFEDVIRHHPDLNEAVPFPRKDFSRWFKSVSLSKIRTYLHSIRGRKYDLVLDAQGLFRSGLICRASRATRRIGDSCARELGPLKHWAYTDVVQTDIESHTVDRMAALTTPLLREQLGHSAVPDTSPAALRLYTAPEAERWADGILPPLPPPTAVPGSKTILLAPTSRWPGKQWPDSRFAALARHFISQGHRVVLVGGKGEEPQIPECLEVFSFSPSQREGAGGWASGHPDAPALSLNLLAQTSIAQLMVAISRADLVVANDSAALHIAVGFARPVVALFGPTRVHRVGPYPIHAHAILQHVTPSDSMVHKDEANGRALMERITLDETIAACEKILTR